jgi:OmcA/MtrC family decaheme c-type cytochrome
MKNLILIFLFLIIGCTQTPYEKDKEKGILANVLVPFANFYRTPPASDADGNATQSNANAIALAKSLPLLDLSTDTAYDPSTSAGRLAIQALDFSGGVITGVDMSTGYPKVTFYVTTKTHRLKGFGWTTKTDGSYNATTGAIQTPGATTIISNLTAVTNLQFTFAKFVAGTNGSPDKWVSYLTTTIPTPNGTIGPSYTAFKRSTPGWQKNSTDQNGTIVDNGDGSYTYTFARDITKSKDYISSEYLTATNEVMTAVSANRQSGTGDLTYNTNIPHRMAIGVGVGSIRGTSTNNVNGSNQPSFSGGCSSQTTCSGTLVSTLNFTNGKTIIYDFIPATGQIKAAQKDIVRVDTCNRCHKDANATTTSGITTRGLIFHGSGGRNDVTSCVTCHTDQTRGQSDLNDISVNGVYSGAAGTSPANYGGFVLDGYAVADFPIMVHKFHMSSQLTKRSSATNTGYFVGGVTYQFPTKGAAFFTKADTKLCYNCHTTNKSAINEDNWKTKPSRIACGSCHDGIDWATGQMYKSVNTSNSDVTHGGGKQLDDSKCAGCHTVSDVIKKHGL